MKAPGGNTQWLSQFALELEGPPGLTEQVAAHDLYFASAEPHQGFLLQLECLIVSSQLGVTQRQVNEGRGSQGAGIGAPGGGQGLLKPRNGFVVAMVSRATSCPDRSGRQPRCRDHFAGKLFARFEQQSTSFGGARETSATACRISISTCRSRRPSRSSLLGKPVENLVAGFRLRGGTRKIAASAGVRQGCEIGPRRRVPREESTCLVQLGHVEQDFRFEQAEAPAAWLIRTTPLGR